MKAYILSEQEAAATGFSHKFYVPYTDFTGFAATSGAVVLGPYTAGTLIDKAAFRVSEQWNAPGATMTNLTLDVGHNGATTDDDDSLINGIEIHEDATEVLYGDGNGAAFATLRTGYAAADAGNLEMTLTATGANLSTLTSGAIHIYVHMVDLTKF